MFCLPPHTTHECQPLDCSLFGPLKAHWRQTCHAFYQENPGQVISKLNFCRIFKPAWLKSVTPENIIGGFKKAGVFPFNPSAVPLPALGEDGVENGPKESSSASGPGESSGESTEDGDNGEGGDGGHDNEESSRDGGEKENSTESGGGRDVGSN